ncbi:hypothetical protein [Scytonema millei]|uniref:Uncharacterized protein n=1 Tax=Scytonema millei VB511283 TaxID=1245923 RepID=A0A9X5E9S2_9CYAN|nr:hypothetical protein [Scytonema millei]NHC37945.1 hypothetical protein [Scytonema millei VB511283]
MTSRAEEYRYGTTYIDPIELPYLTHCRIFLVGATSFKAKPSWYRAGYLHQQIDGVAVDDSVVFEGLQSTPTTAIDGSQRMIPLNSMQLVVFPKLADSYRLRFQPMRWLKELTLGIWEYRGIESDSTEDLIQVVRAKLETIEFKVDQL